jgi:ADP-ribosylglycohydrolase/fructose-1,6-bisphosphatase/inositol monophosphatase family enzyme
MNCEPGDVSAGYGIALVSAISAARDASFLLAAEVRRPGGPHGTDGYCPVDLDAEAFIRARLESDFPDFGVIGEELKKKDRPSRDPNGHVWLIDPNDGTSAMLRGHRGAAVSIALLRQGVPVVGVVVAYAPPFAGRGEDLFAWAEGMPLTRNGVTIDRRALRLPTAEDTVAVSQDADREFECNAMLVAPARYLAVPSVAYRLALVAAGDVEAAVSLGSPRAWNYAAGHALLRAVGGELFDETGRPITYDVSGVSACRYCFGGVRELSAAYAAKDWEIALHHGDPDPGPYDLVWPRPDSIFADDQLLSRAQGCLLGQCAGDSLGSLVEFQDAREIRARHPDGVLRLEDGGVWNTIAGQPTDDSEMALMLARALVQAGRFDDAAVAEAYAHWYASPPFDAGNTTRQALRPAVEAQHRGGDVAAAARQAANRDSQANGALMRISPLGIFGHAAEPDQLAQWARADATLTHPHPLCRDASALFAVTIAHAVRSGETPANVYAFARRWADAAGIHDGVRESLAAAESAPPEDYVRQMGWVRIALHNAYFQLLHAPSLEAGVLDTVMRGGDTDTTGAICGALLGAVHGVAAVPQQWRDRVLTCRPISEHRGVRRPRCFWPVDALHLAERLLCFGSKAAGDSMVASSSRRHS